MINYSLVNSGQKLHFTDLLSNRSIFDEKYSVEELHKLPDWNDNSDYSSYTPIEDILNNFDPDIDEGRTYTCLIGDEYIFTSDSSKGGFDRGSQTSDEKCRQNLNQTINGSDEPKGFDDNAAGILNAYIRYYVDKNGHIYFYVVKNMGNHRLWMKLLTHKGKKVKLPFKIKFHKLSEKLEQSDFIRIEADAHHSDAGDRQSQNENQKFYSGLLSNRKEFLDAFSYLQKHRIEYAGIMKQQNIEGCDGWPILNSIYLLNKGFGNGIFKDYKETNVDWAMKTAREIALKVTKEEVIPNSAIRCFASMFYYLTEQFSDSSGKLCSSLFDKDELKDFFVLFFKEKNTTSIFRKNKLLLKDLSISSGVKDINYICASIFWNEGAIIEYFKTTKNRNNGFKSGNPNMNNFIQDIDVFFRKSAAAMVNV